MKKLFLRVFCLLLCLGMLCSCLCGCSLLEKFIDLPEISLPTREEEAPAEQQFTLPITTEFYAEPSWDAPVVSIQKAGTTVSYSQTVTLDGVTWAQTSEGWFALDGSRPGPKVEIYSQYFVNNTRAFPYDSIPIYDQPASFSDVLGRADPGDLLEISEMAETAEGTWGFAAVGWVNMQNVYVEGSFRADGSRGYHSGFGVVREENVAFCDLPNWQSSNLVFADSGFRFEIYEQIFISGSWWAYTPHGWVCMDFIYEEGTVGTRPCTAMVIDKTPLNVRVAPGTDNEILTTLRYGDYVRILERIERNGKDWGFTGTGWIYMDLTEIQ